jgi:uncharacterized membrane protein YbhN (UPF0104 family)
MLVGWRLVTYSVGLLTALGLAFMVEPHAIPRVPGLPFNSNRLRVAISLGDWVFSAACLFALLPGSTPTGFPRFSGIFLLGEIAGLISQLPAGIGVFEAVVVRILRESSPVTGTLGALIAYRAVYYLIPLMLTIPLLMITEIRHFRGRKGDPDQSPKGTTG